MGVEVRAELDQASDHRICVAKLVLSLS
jgi:hypothetical protein